MSETEELLRDAIEMIEAVLGDLRRNLAELEESHRDRH